METAAVAKLKASLSEYLAMVKAGEEVIVTDRGKPVARLVPLIGDRRGSSPHLLALERAGLARIGTGQLPRNFWRLPRPTDTKGMASALLLKEREQGR